MKVLHLEDNSSDAELTHDWLLAHWPDCVVTSVASEQEFNVALTQDVFEVILADLQGAGYDGRSSLRVARQRCPNTPFVFLSRTIDEEQAFALVREGASDYVFKDRLFRLGTVLPRVLREVRGPGRHLEAEAQLRQSEERFRSIFLNLVEGVVLLDRAGLIVSANPSAIRILRIAPELLIGRSAIDGWQVVREDLSPVLPANLPTAVALRTGVRQSDVTLGLAHASPDVLWVTVNVEPLHDGEAVAGAVVTFHDITEKKRLQEQYFRAQRLESLGLLAAGIAHDMNNVLAPVLIGAPLLKERANPDDAKILQTIISSVERGADLVRQILGFTKGASSEQRVVQLKHLVADVESLLGASLPKSITVTADLEANLWLAMANPSQIHQVLLNLCINARDAMPSGGHLGITVRNHWLNLKSALARRVLSPGPYLLIEVSDTGSGIPAGLLDKIWEPFFTTKGDEKGTGLGLPTVRGIIQNHHGDIEVESTKGSGTTFRILLPAVAESTTVESRQSNPPFPANRGGGELVLVVDDEEEIRALVTRLLTKSGYRVVGAINGIQAYGQLLQRGDEIRLLITDLSMPELDGAGLALLTRRQFPEIKILTISGRSSATGLGTNPVLYSDGFLQKPFKPGALLDRVHTLISTGVAHPVDRGALNGQTGS